MTGEAAVHIYRFNKDNEIKIRNNNSDVLGVKSESKSKSKTNINKRNKVTSTSMKPVKDRI